MPVGRTFSFEEHDEGALSPTRNEQEPLRHSSPYHDQTPSRDVISPPPQYFSPSPAEPATPTPAAGRYQPSPQQAYPPQDYSRPRSASPPSPIASPDLPPPPPPHRTVPVDDSQHDSRYEGAWRTPSAVTPGMDNFGDNIQGGGLDHVARSVADQRQRESGVEAQIAMDAMASSRHGSRSLRRGSATSQDFGIPRRPVNGAERASYGSNIPFAAGAATPGSITPVASPHHLSSRRSDGSVEMYAYPPAAPLPGGYLGNYHDSPYMNAAQRYNATVSDASINPYDIVDDGDDGFMPEPKRRSILSASRQASRERAARRASKPPSSAGSSIAPPAIGTAGVGIGAEEAIPAGHRWGRRRNQVPSGSYDPVRQGGVLDGAGNPSSKEEKQAWLDEEKRHHKKMGWTVGLVIGLVIVLAVIGGAVGGVLGNKTNNSGSSDSDNTAGGDTAANGDLDSNSPEIVALLNNKDLHKVFPGVDYTPWGTQYPDCLTYPPSQNNVTRDMAVLSQLTNAVRLYGTDCNQTEMVLHSIDRLGLTNMKVWLGVWIDYSNMTTTNRQIAQMYKILSDAKDISIFKGAIIGNEVLYRAGNSATVETDLIQTLTDIRANFTSLGYTMPVGTSDLGDNWTGQLVEGSDMVMSNIHPFFAGVSAEDAAPWTLNFWNTHDKTLTASGTGTESGKKQIISETGWPSGGGTDCGGATGACTSGQAGSVAGVDGMNTFLQDWVCSALSNETEYFWFEAFDEPWKVQYNTPTQQWEDKWGLMDPARKLKDGLVIPSCGGETVDGKFD